MPAHTVGRFSDAIADTLSPAPRGAQPALAAENGRGKLNAAAAKPASVSLEPDLPKALTPTRNLRLEVGSGDQRVELHLVEHAGDVHVAVRTPDSHLAGELRENLPTLSSRLEQIGLRPEEWHTAAPVNGEGRHQVESSTDTSAFEPNTPSHPESQQRQGDPEQRPPNAAEEQTNRKPKGEQFAWYMASLP